MISLVLTELADTVSENVMINVPSLLSKVKSTTVGFIKSLSTLVASTASDTVSPTISTLLRSTKAPDRKRRNVLFGYTPRLVLLFSSLKSSDVNVIVIEGPSSSDTFPPDNLKCRAPGDVELIMKKSDGSTDDAEIDSEKVKLSTPVFRSRKKDVKTGGTVSIA